MINGHGAEPHDSTLAAAAAPVGAGNGSPALKKPAYHTKRSNSVNGNSKTTAVPVAVGVSVGVMGGGGHEQSNTTTSITTGGGLRPQSVGVKRGISNPL